jgi:hypothetical protein
MPRVESTSGGRAIPPRSELRNSFGAGTTLPPARSELRNSQQLNVQPLNTGHQHSAAQNENAIVSFSYFLKFEIEGMEC